PRRNCFRSGRGLDAPRQAGALERLLARSLQALGHVVRKFTRRLVEARGHAQGEAGLQGFLPTGRQHDVLVLHSVIPLAFRAFANACTAREQCVLTLPSEQPITAAVSATSSSSQ